MDLVAQLTAAREATLAFGWSSPPSGPRTHLRLTGRDAVSWFHGFCTQDIKQLRVGQHRETFLCNVKGRILGHVQVFRDESELWLETVPGQGDALLKHLDRYLITEDVQLTAATETLMSWLLVGPTAAAVLGQLGWPGSDLVAGEHRTEDVLGTGSGAGSAGCRIARVSWLDGPAWLMVTPASATSAMHSAFTAAGIPIGDDAAWDALRVAAGYPQYGRDLTEDHLAQEAGRTPQCISFTKGCYLGQEPIARIDAMGHINRQLTRLHGQGATLPATGSPITRGDDPKVLGQISSAAWTQPGQAFVALGMLRVSAATAAAAAQSSDESNDQGLFADGVQLLVSGH